MCICVYSWEFMCTVCMQLPMEARGHMVPATGVIGSGEGHDVGA